MKYNAVTMGTCDLSVEAKLEKVVAKDYDIQHLVLKFYDTTTTFIKVLRTNRKEVKQLAKLISKVADEFHD